MPSRVSVGRSSIADVTDMWGRNFVGLVLKFNEDQGIRVKVDNGMVWVGKQVMQKLSIDGNLVGERKGGKFVRAGDFDHTVTINHDALATVEDIGSNNTTDQPSFE